MASGHVNRINRVPVKSPHSMMQWHMVALIAGVLKAIKGGRIAGIKDKLGKWHVDPAELHLVYPAVGEPGVGQS